MIRIMSRMAVRYHHANLIKLTWTFSYVTQNTACVMKYEAVIIDVEMYFEV